MQTRTIPLLEVIPETVENKHFYTNGLSKLIPHLTLKVHSDLEKCYVLWDKFSPKQTLFDLWDFRYSFYEGYKCTPFFYTLYEGKKVLGVLPLWYDEYENKYQWFGGWYHEENRFFVEDEKLIEFLLAVSPAPLKLNSIKQFEKIKKLEMFGALGKDSDLKYFKNIENVSSMDGFLKRLKKKRRYHIKTDYKRLVKQGVRIEKSGNEDSHLLELMISMNKQRFDGVVRDIYPNERDQNSFTRVVRNAEIYDVSFLQAKARNKIAAIDIVISYKDVYYQFAGANDVENFNGSGHYMAYYEIEDAINQGFKFIDCFQEDHSWKHRYFDSREVFEFEK